MTLNMKQKAINFFTKGHNRTLLAKKNIIFSFLIKFLTMIVTFTTISLSIKYLGKDAYGVWVILAGLLVWTDLFDFGFTHGLRNMLAEAIAKEEIDKGKSYVSTTFAVMFFVSALLVTVFIPIIEIIDWNMLLNFDFISDRETKTLLYIVLTSFILKMLYKPITAVLNAVQWPSIVQLISLIGAIFALIALYFLLMWSEISSLITYVITQSAAPIIVLIFASAYLFKNKFKNIKPSIDFINFSYFRQLFTLGGSFFLMQLSWLVIYQTDNIIIANLFGPSSVTEYNIVQRYFSILSIAIGVLTAPFWSAFTDAYAKNELEWIKNSINKLIKIMLWISLIAIFLVIISNKIYQTWIDPSLFISPAISGMMAISVMITGFFNIFIYVINGIGKIRLSIYSNLFAAVLNIPLCFYFADTLMLGLKGILLASIICTSLVGLLTFIQYQKIINSTALGIWNK